MPTGMKEIGARSAEVITQQTIECRKCQSAKYRGKVGVWK
jgi:hypothetical protein